MEFKDGTRVYTADDKEIGLINRVVLDPHSKIVTHIVTQQGGLFTEDMVIPVELVAHADDKEIRLAQTKDQLPDFLPFEETHYVPLDDDAQAYPTRHIRPYFAYPPLGTAWWGYPGYIGFGANPAVASGVSPTRVEQNIPDRTVGLSEGAKVVSADGESLGELGRVCLANESARATHIVVVKGWLFKERKLIPTSWISKIEEKKVYLGISKLYFERLPAFEGT